LFVAGFAAIKGAQVFGSFVSDAAESAKISRITENAIKATGGAAKITADQVGDLATSISNKTAIDDEQVQTAANMLLTFKNIRNETGKNNDIFNRATMAAADLSVQFGGIDGASKQLGKALNDPVKGISALSKAGVTFTAQQKEQIKTLVASGDTLGAQKIILKEIEGQVGGAAAAAADPIERLKVVSGNLAEEVGGFLLPTVSKFASFVSDKVIPGISSLFSLFKTGDFTADFAKAFGVEEDSKLVDFLLTIRETAIAVFGEIKGGFAAFAAAWKYNDGEITSSGFPGFMERLGYAARQTFDFFKAEVLPRLRDFGGFIAGSVIPAVGNLVVAFAPLARDVGTAVVGTFQKLWPVLQSVGSFIGTTIVPAVQSFTGWLKENSTIVGAVAVGIGAIVLALKAYQLTLTIVGGVAKAFAAVQAALNVVMSLNPIGLVVLALVGLAAGLVYAYKKSETFRDIVNGVFTAVVGAGRWMWEEVLKPIFGFLIGQFKTAWENAQTFGRLVSAGFDAVKEPARAALAFVVDQFLGFVDNILTGAAKAFGWVPELGDKLKTAADKFGTFRDDVNAKLKGIHDEPVDIKVGLAYTQALGQKTKQMKFATGGPVFGAGTATSDSIPALLSNNEHVLTAREVSGAGGHKAVEQMRSQWAKGYATGGPVVHPEIPSGGRLAALASTASAGVSAVGSAIAKSIAQQLVKAQSSPGLAGALNWSKSQAGKPYVWGGVGPGGYDCSGFMSAITNFITGRSLHRRLFATGSFPTSMFARGQGAFTIGSRRGNPGHMAGTLNGVHVESRGGEGVVVGSRARGASNSLFGGNMWHLKGYARGGPVGDMPFDFLDRKGKHFQGDLARALGVQKFDTGLRAGGWAPGTLAYNGTGKTETVRTAEQEAAVGRPMQIRVFIGDREISEIARVEVDEAFRDMATSFNI
jgi:phage-related protein